jgi:hypothetical protein
MMMLSIPDAASASLGRQYDSGLRSWDPGRRAVDDIGEV